MKNDYVLVHHGHELVLRNRGNQNRAVCVFDPADIDEAQKVVNFLNMWPEVQKLATHLQGKLNKHAHKGESWRNMTDIQLLMRQEQEIGELRQEIGLVGSPDAVWDEAADVASWPMFMAANYERAFNKFEAEVKEKLNE